MEGVEHRLPLELHDPEPEARREGEPELLREPEEGLSGVPLQAGEGVEHRAPRPSDHLAVALEPCGRPGGAVGGDREHAEQDEVGAPEPGRQVGGEFPPEGLRPLGEILGRLRRAGLSRRGEPEARGLPGLSPVPGPPPASCGIPGTAPHVRLAFPPEVASQRSRATSQ